MRATLRMECTCGQEPLQDDNLALSDAPFVRTWIQAHQAPGHTVTVTVVASYDEDQPHPLTLMGAARTLTRLAGALFPLHP